MKLVSLVVKNPNYHHTSITFIRELMISILFAIVSNDVYIHRIPKTFCNREQNIQMNHSCSSNRTIKISNLMVSWITFHMVKCHPSLIVKCWMVFVCCSCFTYGQPSLIFSSLKNKPKQIISHSFPRIMVDTAFPLALVPYNPIGE